MSKLLVAFFSWQVASFLSFFKTYSIYAKLTQSGLQPFSPFSTSTYTQLQTRFIPLRSISRLVLGRDSCPPPRERQSCLENVYPSIIYPSIYLSSLPTNSQVSVNVIVTQNLSQTIPNS